MDKTQLPKQGMMAMDQPLLRIPLKQLKRQVLLSHKYSEYGLQQIMGELNSLMQLYNGSEGTEASLKAAGIKSLKKVILLTDNLKKKMAKTESEKGEALDRLSKRLSHLSDLAKVGSVTSKEFNDWMGVRFDVILATYMLRNGYLRTAELMVKDKRIGKLVDSGLFLRAREIEESLRRRELSECLKWCHENRPSLATSKSTLEFTLRLQEYIELVREGKREQAIQLSRKCLSAWKTTHLNLINSAGALLIYPPETPYNPYEGLYDPGRWEKLISQFRSDYLAINNFPQESLFIATIQAGLTVLKSPACYSDEPELKSPDCPVCSKSAFGILAMDLPNVHQVNPVLIDSVTRETMDDENPPLALPNGFVYSRRHLREIANSNGGSMVVCPRTGEGFKLSSCRKVFIS